MRSFLTRIGLFGVAALVAAIAANAWVAPEVVIESPPKVAAAGQSSSSSSSVKARAAERAAKRRSSSSPGAASSSSLPGSVLIRVPFSPQAPFAVWDPLHEEACEEMALIMVQHFWTGDPLSRSQAEEELLRLVAWMQERGYGVDVTMTQLAEVARNHYGLRATIDADISLENIQRYVSSGRPVIIPAAGRDLGNPYFSGAGPWYHALVITGYDGVRFITNDPGTRRGEGYRYRYEILLAAIHDWTGVKEETRRGRPVLLVLER